MVGNFTKESRKGMKRGNNYSSSFVVGRQGPPKDFSFRGRTAAMLAGGRG